MHEAEQRRQQAIEEGRFVDPNDLSEAPQNDTEEFTREVPSYLDLKNEQQTALMNGCPHRLIHISGKGPLDSSIAAYRMLADHLGLPFRKELFRTCFRRSGQAAW